MLPVRPTFGKGLGATAGSCEPHMEQMFVGSADGVQAGEFDAVLFGCRKKAQNLCSAAFAEDQSFYICSLSSRVITYKGMLTAEQLTDYFEDLNDEDCESHVALVHSRFATNTFPGWKRAHPYRYMCHNGEINTVRGNMNWQVCASHSPSARQGHCSSGLRGIAHISTRFPRFPWDRLGFPPTIITACADPRCVDPGTPDGEGGRHLHPAHAQL